MIFQASFFFGYCIVFGSASTWKWGSSFGLKRIRKLHPKLIFHTSWAATRELTSRKQHQQYKTHNTHQRCKAVQHWYSANSRHEAQQQQWLCLDAQTAVDCSSLKRAPVRVCDARVPVVSFHHRFKPYQVPSYVVWNQGGLSGASSQMLSPRATTPALIRQLYASAALRGRM